MNPRRSLRDPSCDCRRGREHEHRPALLRLLRHAGLLEFRRGIHVAGTPERGAAFARSRELVRFARQQGYRTDEMIKIIESVG